MAKGSSFERWFCYELSSWWTGQSKEDKDFEVAFWRTAGSGARATSRGKVGKRAEQAGDIAATDERGRSLTDVVSIECKNGYTSNGILHQLLDRPARAKPTKWEEWIVQARRSATISKRPHWMIVHRRTRWEPLVAMNNELWMSLYPMPVTGLLKTSQVPCAGFKVADPESRQGTIDFVVMTLDRFMFTTEPAQFRELAARLKG